MQEGTDSRETDEQDWTLHILTPQGACSLLLYKMRLILAGRKPPPFVTAPVKRRI